MYENSGRALPKGSLDSKSATGCTQIELAIRSTRSTKPRRTIILGPTRRCEELRWNPFWRISGVPLSAVEQQETTRENKVKKLIEKFENHQHKESFLQDLSQTQKVNKFSKESKDLFADLNNTEIFELCDNSSKQQCPSFAAVEELWSLRGVQRSSTRTITTSPQSLAMSSRRTAVVVPNTDLLKDKECTTMRSKCLRKPDREARRPSILSRWYACDEYRKSLSDIGWREHHLMLYNRIALEKHIYVATRAERIQKSKHWILTLIAEGPQQPLNQRPDFAQAKRECKRLHDEYMARTQQDYRTILRSQQVRQRKEKQFEGIEEYDYAVDPQTSWRFYKESRWNLPTASSSSSNWDQTDWKTSSWNSQHSSRSDDLWFFLRVRTIFGCLVKNLQTTDGVCEQYTPKYSKYRVAQHDHISSRKHAWLKLERSGLHIFVSYNNCHPSVMSHSMPHLTLTTSTNSLSNTHKTFGTRSLFTLRCSTAEWRINTNPISDKSLMTQRVEWLSVSVLVHDHYSHARNCTGLPSNTGLFLSTGNT